MRKSLFIAVMLFFTSLRAVAQQDDVYNYANTLSYLHCPITDRYVYPANHLITHKRIYILRYNKQSYVSNDPQKTTEQFSDICDAVWDFALDGSKKFDSVSTMVYDSVTQKIVALVSKAYVRRNLTPQEKADQVRRFLYFPNTIQYRRNPKTGRSHIDVVLFPEKCSLKLDSTMQYFYSNMLSQLLMAYLPDKKSKKNPEVDVKLLGNNGKLLEDYIF